MLSILLKGDIYVLESMLSRAILFNARVYTHQAKVGTKAKKIKEQVKRSKNNRQQRIISNFDSTFA